MRPIERERRFAALEKIRDLVLAQLADASREPTPGRKVLSLVIELLGSRVTVCDAQAYFGIYGRSQGYDIPPYAYAGSGDIRVMLRDANAKDLREWYATIGVDAQHYDHIVEYSLVVPINRSYRHRCYYVPYDMGTYSDEKARTLALHLIDFCTGSEAPDVPQGIDAGNLLF